MYLGYHLFNLTVHLGSAILVWWFMLLTFSTPVMKDRRLPNTPILSLFSGHCFHDTSDANPGSDLYYPAGNFFDNIVLSGHPYACMLNQGSWNRKGKTQ